MYLSFFIGVPFFSKEAKPFKDSDRPPVHAVVSARAAAKDHRAAALRGERVPYVVSEFMDNSYLRTYLVILPILFVVVTVVGFLLLKQISPLNAIWIFDLVLGGVCARRRGWPRPQEQASAAHGLRGGSKRVARTWVYSEAERLLLHHQTGAFLVHIHQRFNCSFDYACLH